MLKTETKQIGDCEYVVTQLDAVRARRVFMRFGKVYSAISKAREETKAGSDAAAVLEAAFGKVLEVVTPEDLDFFVDQFASSTSVREVGSDKSPRLSEVIALHFVGERFVDQFAWLVFCFEVNFGSFFQRLAQSSAGSPAKAAST